MSMFTAIRNWQAGKDAPPTGKHRTQAQIDAELIARATRKEQLDNLRADCRTELERDDLTLARREAVHALLRESYRQEGLSEDLIYHCGVLKRRSPEDAS